MESIVIEALPSLAIALAFRGFLSAQTCDSPDAACAQVGRRVEKGVQDHPRLAQIARYIA